MGRFVKNRPHGADTIMRRAFSLYAGRVFIRRHVVPVVPFSSIPLSLSLSWSVCPRISPFLSLSLSLSVSRINCDSCSFD